METLPKEIMLYMSNYTFFGIVNFALTSKKFYFLLKEFITPIDKYYSQIASYVRKYNVSHFKIERFSDYLFVKCMYSFVHFEDNYFINQKGIGITKIPNFYNNFHFHYEFIIEHDDRNYHKRSSSFDFGASDVFFFDENSLLKHLKNIKDTGHVKIHIWMNDLVSFMNFVLFEGLKLINEEHFMCESFIFSCENEKDFHILRRKMISDLCLMEYLSNFSPSKTCDAQCMLENIKSVEDGTFVPCDIINPYFQSGIMYYFLFLFEMLKILPPDDVISNKFFINGRKML